MTNAVESSSGASSRDGVPRVHAQHAAVPLPSEGAPAAIVAAAGDGPPPVAPSGSGSSRPSDATYISPSSAARAAALAPPVASLPSVGQRLDHFEILELIGGGGMGLVYRARDTALDRIVAIKVLSTNRAVDEETVRRFRNEAQSAARLDHDNIARVYYVGEARGLNDDAVNYIVLEYIDGTNLRDLVADQGPLPVDVVLAHALQLAHALDHASSRGVVHRDIKPSNVLVTREGRAKLVDMGLSRLQEPGSDDDLTASGVTLGTFDYISPEQARDPRNADVRSDIYSLGCTLFYLLTGQPPFPSGNVMQKLLQHQGDEPPGLSQLNPAVPEELARIVRKMLGKDPRRRYQDARSLIVDLSLLCEQLGLELPSAGVTLLLPAASPWRRAIDRLAPWVVAAAALITAVVVLDRLWAGRHGAFELAAPAVGGREFGAAGAQEGPEKPAPSVDAGSAGTGLTGTGALPGASPGPTPAPAKAKTINGEPPPSLPPIEDERPRSSPDAAGARLAAGGSVGLKAGGGSTSRAGDATLAAAHLAAKDVAKDAANSPVPAPPPANVLIVDPAADGSRPYEFLSLEAAVKKLDKDRNTIELRYTGRPQRNDIPLSESPLKLSRLGNVTIRAAKGCRPLIVFEPTLPEPPALAPQQMIGMLGLSDVGLLTLANVELELRPPAQPPGRRGDFALASLVRSSIELQGCTLTASCATDERRKISFFAVEAESSSSAMMMSMETGGAEKDKMPVSIKLRDCVARGDASLVRATQPLELDWSNGLAALTEPLFVGESAMPARGRWNLEFEHLTAHLRGGLFAFTHGPQPLETNVTCKYSILICPADAPLFRTSGDDTHANLKGKLNWSNVQSMYDDVRKFWDVSDAAGRQPPEAMKAADWQGHWAASETPALRDADAPLGWRVPPERNSRPLRERSPWDYALKADSQAVGKASGKDVGFGLDDLPKPPPPASEPAAASGAQPG